MNKQYWARVSKAEHARVAQVLKTFEEKERLEPVDLGPLFRNEDLFLAVTRKGNTILAGFDATVLPSIALFYPQTMVEVCGSCKCVAEPSLLEPFLERGLATPVLPMDYDMYPSRFVETVTRYPHLSSAEFNIYRDFSLMIQRDTYMCSHCRSAFAKKLRSSPKRFPVRSKIGLLKSLVSTAGYDLSPFLSTERVLAEDIIDSVTAGNVARLRRLLSISSCVGLFRTAEAFSAVPQVRMRHYATFEALTKRIPELKIDSDISEIRSSVLQGLRLAYDPTIPVSTYLDIVLARRDRIRRLASDIVEKSKPASSTFYSNLQKEIEKINSEILSLRSSKRGQLLEFATGFLSRNKSVVAGCLIGSSLGAAQFGLVGCTSGTLAGSIAGEILRRFGKVSVPQQGKRMKEALLSTVEPTYQKLLSVSLSKSLSAIQVWDLQRRLKPT